MKLTEKAITQLSLPGGINDQLISDDDLDNFGLRLRRRANGQVNKTWVLRYWIAGAERRISLDFAGENLGAARKWASDLKAKIRLGFDPAQEKMRARINAEQTLRIAIDGYLAEKKTEVRKSSYYVVQHYLLDHCRPLHNLPLRQVTANDVSGLHLTLLNANSPYLAANTRAWLGTFFVWAMGRGLVDRNPCLGVGKRPVSQRDRVLTMDELKAVWAATADGSNHSAIVRLLALTGARAREIGELEWSEIRSDRLELPPARMKNNRAHTIYLTQTMRGLIDSRRRGPDQARAFIKNGSARFSGWGYHKAFLDKRIAECGIVMQPWQLHDLRRTFATGLGELGVAPHVIEAAIGHASGFRAGIAGVYNRSTLEPQIRHALAVWDQHIREIVEGRVGGDRVVPLRA